MRFARSAVVGRAVQRNAAAVHGRLQRRSAPRRLVPRLRLPQLPDADQGEDGLAVRQHDVRRQ
jgi:hypothetical protein